MQSYISCARILEAKLPVSYFTVGTTHIFCTREYLSILITYFLHTLNFLRLIKMTPIVQLLVMVLKQYFKMIFCLWSHDRREFLKHIYWKSKPWFASYILQWWVEINTFFKEINTLLTFSIYRLFSNLPSTFAKLKRRKKKNICHLTWLKVL